MTRDEPAAATKRRATDVPGRAVESGRRGDDPFTLSLALRGKVTTPSD
jgi:hypothetical protein